MISTSETTLEQLALHYIGNKNREETLLLSDTAITPDEQLQKIIQTYFLTPFKWDEFYNLFHEESLDLNEVYAAVTGIFDDPDSLPEQSKLLARHLYEQTNHPNIKEGEFYVAFFKDVLIEDELVSAVGLFKSEHRDTYLKINENNGNLFINHDEGIDIHKLDKGCLIFNTEKEKGYLTAIVDNINKREEAVYWRENFLNVIPRNDNYNQTKNALNLCREYVTRQLPSEFEVNKADQADLLNRSVNYFKEKETFNFDEFSEEILQQPEAIQSFKDFKTTYQEEYAFPENNEFSISAPAVKKQQKVFKSVIKLDKNFHVYVHGNKQWIEKGFDEAAGMHYYKLYYNEES